MHIKAEMVMISYMQVCFLNILTMNIIEVGVILILHLQVYHKINHLYYFAKQAVHFTNGTVSSVKRGMNFHLTC